MIIYFSQFNNSQLFLVNLLFDINFSKIRGVMDRLFEIV